jgi:hypothetical protein
MYGDLKVKFEAERRIPYLGGELRPHFLLETFGIGGTGVGAGAGLVELPLPEEGVELSSASFNAFDMAVLMSIPFCIFTVTASALETKPLTNRLVSDSFKNIFILYLLVVVYVLVQKHRRRPNQIR